MNNQISLTVNGIKQPLDPIPGETLSALLRERLRLTGTKIGCEESECGACTVLVDGEPVLSCMYPAERADGKQVVTIEGLAALTPEPLRQTQNGQSSAGLQGLHPLQQAFIEHGAVQCGFCIPGQLMTAQALLERKLDPAQEEIRAALKDTLCRCAGYPSIENAILAAATSLRTGEALPPPPIPPSFYSRPIV